MKTFKNLIEEQSIPDENKNGDCYVKAYQYFMEKAHSNKNLRLVHGLVTGQGDIKGIVYNHAWVEDGNKVIDKSINKTFPKYMYYKIGEIQEKNVFRYNFQEVLEKIQKFGTYGPWEKKLINNKY